MAAEFHSDDEFSAFSGPRNFKVAPGDTFFYPVEFFSAHEGEFFATLTTTNLSDGTQNVFNITGYALEPKISKVLNLGKLHCQESRVFGITVPHFCNGSRMRWQISTSIENVLSGI